MACVQNTEPPGSNFTIIIFAKFSCPRIVGVSYNYGEFINPRRACAARVTVVGLCIDHIPREVYDLWSVCLSVVCLSTTILALQATRRLMSDTNSFGATRA